VPVPLSKRQSEILDALEALFLERGFRSLSVAELTATAHCSRATLYELARTKEELFLLVLERIIHRIDVQGRAAAAKVTDPTAKIEAYVTRNVEELSRTGPGFVDDTTQYRPAARLLNDFAATAVATLQRFIEEGIANGVFPDVDAEFAALMLVAMAQQLTSRQFQAMAGQPWTESVRAGLNMLVYGIVGGASPRRRRR
jgi:AcrR family transcriptional regulator